MGLAILALFRLCFTYSSNFPELRLDFRKSLAMLRLKLEGVTDGFSRVSGRELHPVIVRVRKNANGINGTEVYLQLAGLLRILSDLNANV